MEIRAYPRILGDFKIDMMDQFLNAEVDYVYGMMTKDTDRDRKSITAWSVISQSIKKTLDRCEERMRNLDS